MDDLGDLAVVEADDRDVAARVQAPLGQRAQHPHRQRVGGADEGRRGRLVEQHRTGLAAAPHGVLDPRGHPGRREPSLLQRPAPPGPTVLADAGVLAPPDPRDPLVAAFDQVAGGQLGAGGTVDVDPGVAGIGVVPRAAEGDERRAPLAQPRGLRVAEVGVGDDEGVDRGRAQQVVVPLERVGALPGEEQHVVAGLARGPDQGVHEAVHRGVGGALLHGAEPQPDEVGGAGAQVARGTVGQVAELVDGLLHAHEGVGAQQVGVVDRVGDGLARDTGARRDVGEGRW